MPRARVLALALGPGADTVPMGLAILPAAAVGTAVVKVEPSPVDAGGGGGGARGGGRRHAPLPPYLLTHDGGLQAGAPRSWGDDIIFIFLRFGAVISCGQPNVASGPGAQPTPLSIIRT